MIPRAALLIAMTLVALLLTAARPVSFGEGPVHIDVPLAPFQGVWTRVPVHFIGLGDSITVGVGATRLHGYFDRLVASPSDEPESTRCLTLGSVLPSLRTSQLAVGGTSSFAHERQAGRMRRTSEDEVAWVVMTTGGNDIMHTYGWLAPREGAMYGAPLSMARPWIERFRNRLDAIVARTAERFPTGYDIFLATIYDPTDGIGATAALGLPVWTDAVAVHAAYNDAIRDAGRNPHVHVVDIHAAFLGHGVDSANTASPYYDPGDPHCWYTDGQHPNDRGHDAMRRLFLRAMLEAAEARGWVRPGT